MADNSIYTDDGQGGRMSVLEHFAELRTRLTWAFVFVVVGTVIGALVASPVLRYIAQPYLDLPGVDGLQVIDPTGSVVSYFRVALLIGLTIAIPMVTYQIVMFFLPALTRNERRYFLLTLPAIFGLFILGVSFAWFVLIPPALTFLHDFQEGLFVTEWESGRYISFVTSLLFWIGLAFETPLVLFILSILGFATAGPLIRNWRLAVVVSAVAAAFITPTIDPVNMFLVMGPLLVLYVISIGLVAIGSRMYRRRITNANAGQNIK